MLIDGAIVQCFGDISWTYNANECSSSSNNVVTKTTCCGCVSLFFLSFLKLYPNYTVLIFTYQCTMLCRFWTISNYSPPEPTWQSSVALTFHGKLMRADLWIPIMCLKAHYMKLMLSMVAVSVTQIRAVIFVSDTVNSESCNGQIFVKYVENFSN
jgi:hypothetical protein